MSKEYKVLINDRNYTSWVFHDMETNTDLLPETHEQLTKINPIQYKLFTSDMIHEDGSLIYSFVRKCTNLAGVLILEKTYGRTENKKRLLYKCIPHDKRIPFFLVPYDIKVGFQKNLINKYVIFKFDNWNGQFPQGIIQEVLGNVDDLEAFYEYQLYCRSLHDSMREFIKQAKYLKNNDDNIKKILNNPCFTIEQRLDEYIFTIDSQSSTDLDDGFGVTKIDDNCNRLSIYISNVFFWMETFDMWGSFSERVATIYLPNYKRPLLPTILSSDLCSLLENQQRFAFVMDIYVDNSGNILKHDLKNALIRVKKNWCYEDPKMIAKDKNYNRFLELTQLIDSNIKDSHDLVTYWMVQMNKFCGKYMIDEKIGIFRSMFFNVKQNSVLDISNESKIANLNEDVRRVITTWSNMSGQYMLYSDNENLYHDILETRGYIHITSPIRRLVDLLNQLLLLQRNKMITTLSASAEKFLERWTSKMDYINTSMRSIRKIQTDCELLQRCHNDPTIMNRIYSGIVFDKIIKNDGMITYMVFIQELKILSRVTTHVNVDDLSNVKIQLFLFDEEYNSRKKIRLQIINNHFE